MEKRDDPDVPEPQASSPPIGSRNLTTHEVKAVIRRAVELEAGSAAHTDEGVSEVDLLRIGQDLGLAPAAVRRAMAEVRGLPAEERGALARIVGPASARAARVVRRPAASTASQIERFLRDVELMVPQRRFPERTRYVRDSSLAAGIARFARGFARAHAPLNFDQLDVAVSPLDAESCLVEVGVDLGGTRGGLAAGILGSGTVVAGGLATAVWATPVADPFMLLGIPVLAGAWFGMRAIYNTIRRSTEDKLESLLDRVEHDELA